MLAWDVGAHGVGHAARNIVLSIMIHRLESVFRQQKTITIRFVVRRRRDSSKRSIVAAGILDIVGGAGRKSLPRINAWRWQFSPEIVLHNCGSGGGWYETSEKAEKNQKAGAWKEAARRIYPECDGEFVNNGSPAIHSSSLTGNASCSQHYPADELPCPPKPEGVSTLSETHLASAEKYAQCLKHERKRNSDNVSCQAESERKSL